MEKNEEYDQYGIVKKPLTILFRIVASGPPKKIYVFPFFLSNNNNLPLPY